MIVDMRRWNVGRQMRNPRHIAERCDGFSAALRPGDADRAGTQSVRRDVTPPSGVTRGGLRLRRGGQNSLVEHELLRVQQRPEDVLVGQSSCSSRCLAMCSSASVQLRPASACGRRPTGTAPRPSRRPAACPWPAGRPGRRPRASLSWISSRVEQVQRLGQVRLADALALAGADALRPAEHVEEVRRERLVRQHDRPVRGVACRSAGRRTASGCRSPGRPRRTAPRPAAASGSSGRRPACRAC